MVVAKFGPKTLEVSANKILTFDDFELTGDLDASSEEASKKKPATTVKGPGLLKISLTVKLSASLGVNVQSEIDSWLGLKDSAVAYPFILCGKAVSLNSFLLKSGSATDYVVTKVAGAPYLTAASLKLEFEEYLPPGAQSSAKKSTAASSSGVMGTVANPYKTPTTAQKATAKRTNKGMG